MKTFTDKSWDSDGKYVEKYSDFLDRLFTLPMSLDDPIVVEDRNDIVQTCIDEIEELRDTMVEEDVFHEGIFSQGSAQSVHKGLLRIIGQVHRIKPKNVSDIGDMIALGCTAIGMVGGLTTISIGVSDKSKGLASKDMSILSILKGLKTR